VSTVVNELGSAAEHLSAEDITCGHIIIDSNAQVGVSNWDGHRFLKVSEKNFPYFQDLESSWKLS